MSQLDIFNVAVSFHGVSGDNIGVREAENYDEFDHYKPSIEELFHYFSISFSITFNNFIDFLRFYFVTIVRTWMKLKNKF